MQVALSRLGDVGDEAELEHVLLGMMRAGAGGASGLATFIVNLEGATAPISRNLGVSWDTRPTGMDGVAVVACRDSSKRVPPCEMYLDKRAGRFGIVHMAVEGDTADAAMGLLARTTQLSRAWVCPSVLAGIAGGVNPTDGRVRVARGGSGSTVRCDGAMLPDGDMDVKDHLQIASEVMVAHSRMCANAEAMRLGFSDTADGTRFGGRTIGLVPSKSIDDVPGFIDGILDGSPPLLMLGARTRIGDCHYRAPTADLENGMVLGISVSPTRIGVGLHPGCSGSGVLRLLACVQMRYDPGLTCRDVTAGVSCG